jgi:hypothetical protein
MRAKIWLCLTIICFLGAATCAQAAELSGESLQMIANLVEYGLIPEDVQLKLEHGALTAGQLAGIMKAIEEKLSLGFVQDPAEIEALAKLAAELEPQFKQAKLNVTALEENLAQVNAQFTLDEQRARLTGTNYVQISDFNAYGPFEKGGGRLADISGGYWGANDSASYQQNTYLSMSQRLDPKTTVFAGLSFASNWTASTMSLSPYWRGTLTHNGIAKLQLNAGHFWQNKLSGLVFASSSEDFFAAGYSQEMNGLKLSGSVGTDTDFQAFVSRQTGTSSSPEAINLQPYQLGGQITGKLSGLSLNVSMFKAFDSIEGDRQLDHSAFGIGLSTVKPLFGRINVTGEAARNSLLYWSDSVPAPSADPQRGAAWVTKLSTSLLGRPLKFTYAYVDPGFSYWRNGAYRLYPNREDVTILSGVERYAKLQGPGQRGWQLDWQLGTPTSYKGAFDLSNLKLQFGNARDLSGERRHLWYQTDFNLKYSLGQTGSALAFRRLSRQEKGRAAKQLTGFELGLIFPNQPFTFQGSLKRGDLENTISWEYPKVTWIDRREFEVDGTVIDLAATYALYPDIQLILGLIRHNPEGGQQQREARYIKLSTKALDKVTIWLRFQHLNYVDYQAPSSNGDSNMLDFYLSHSF